MPTINTQPRVDLRDVTICAVDSLNPELAARAIQRSCEYCDFGDAILFTHAPVDTHARIVATPKLDSRGAYNQFIYRDVIEHIRTNHVLVVQWDGFVVDPFAWRAEFLNYDYIGARWPHLPDGKSVGNGGFSLRSARLMRLLTRDEFGMRDDLAEDVLIGQLHRPALEARYGIRFAPESVADCFSYEAAPPQGPTFGFHDPRNLFRHVGPEHLREFVELAHPGTIASPTIAVLLANFFFSGRDWALEPLYRRMHADAALDGARDAMSEAGVPHQTIDDCMRRCEALLAAGD